MRIFILLILFFISASLYSQSINVELKKELDSIMILDQSTRKLLDTKISDQRKTTLLKELGLSNEEFYSNPWGIINNQDSINQQRVMDIISIYGYPGKSLVGDSTSESAWNVIQHSEHINKYLPLIKRAGEQGELPMHLVAKMEDRHLMNTGKEQIYGTQIYGGKVIDNISGEEKWFFIVWPIKNPKKVNKMRKSIGLETTVEENAARLDVKYEIFTLDKAKKMFNK